MHVYISMDFIYRYKNILAKENLKKEIKCLLWELNHLVMKQRRQ